MTRGRGGHGCGGAEVEKTRTRTTNVLGPGHGPPPLGQKWAVEKKSLIVFKFNFTVKKIRNHLLP